MKKLGDIDGGRAYIVELDSEEYNALRKLAFAVDKKFENDLIMTRDSMEEVELRHVLNLIHRYASMIYDANHLEQQAHYFAQVLTEKPGK